MSKMIFAMISDFYREVAGKEIHTGMVIAHQTFGDMLRWNPHFHAILLEGGFDPKFRTKLYYVRIGS
ncbi:transposase [Marispirochaeta sp.]|uniref:transposase n=1 Tax=Marispirochaeta sp. TaxID=2038653 RepID=UPI0029C841FD|nr:transposase [Marispirochaeta sp.]